MHSGQLHAKEGGDSSPIRHSLPRPQSSLARRPDGELRNAMWKANGTAALVLVPTVHAIQKVAEAVVKVTGSAILVDALDGMTDLRNRLTLAPELRHFFIGKFAVLTLAYSLAM